jgi:hypothetical protein
MEPGAEVLAVSRLDNSRLTAEFGIAPGTVREWMQRELTPALIDRVELP